MDDDTPPITDHPRHVPDWFFTTEPNFFVPCDDEPDFDRRLQLQGMVGRGVEKPDDLTPGESRAWDELVEFYARAKREGFEVMFPNE